MPGTIEGAKKAAVTNRARQGDDYFKRIGQIGGRNGHTGGFAAYLECRCPLITATHHKAQCAGRKSGTISRRRAAE